MSREWRTIEHELIDILRSEGVDLTDNAGDTVVVQGDLVVFSITDLAKELENRGIK